MFPIESIDLLYMYHLNRHHISSKMTFSLMLACDEVPANRLLVMPESNRKPSFFFMEDDCVGHTVRLQHNIALTRELL